MSTTPSRHVPIVPITPHQVAGKDVMPVQILDGSGNPVTSFGGTGGTSNTDGDAFTAGASLGTPIIGAYQSSPSVVSDGKLAIVGITANRELKVSVTSGGTAGTQYTEGDTDSSITGTAIMFESNTGTDLLSVVNASTPLPVVQTGALPAGTNVIGHVIADTGSTTAVTGNVAITVADGADVTLGAKADAKSTATDTTAISVMSVLKQISASVQAPPSQTVTNAGTFAVQAAQSGSWTVTANAGTNLNTSALALETGGNLATIAGAVISQEATTSGVKGVTAFGAVTTNAPSYSTTKSDALSLDVNGCLRVSLKDSPANTNKFLVTADAITFASPQHVIVDSSSSIAVTNAGTFAVQATEADGANVTLGAKADAKSTATDTTAITIMSVLKQISASVQAPPSQAVTNAGTFAVQNAAAGTGGFSVASGTIGATKTDIGTANTAGTVGGWYFYNSNSSVAYVQFFNTQASGVTLGTTAPYYSLGIPATSGANIPANMPGIKHDTAICIAITTTRSGSTGPANTVDYNIWYKQ